MDNNHLFEDEVDEEMAREKAEREARLAETQQQNQDHEQNSSSYDPEQNAGYNQSQNTDYNQSQTTGYNQSQNAGYNQSQATNYNQSQNTGYNSNYTVEADTHKGFAIAGFIISIVALVLCCAGCNVLLAILALVFCIIYLAANNPNKSKKGLAIAGVIIASVSIAVTAVYYVMIFTSPEFQDTYDEILKSLEEEYDYSESDETDEFEDLFDENNDDDDCEDGSCMSDSDSGRGKKHYQDLREEEDGSL